MNEHSDFRPTSRSWRDIPQQVKPRAMSREGRRRYFVGGAKTAAVIAALAVVAGGGVWLARTWAANPAWFSTAAGQPALKKLVLETNGRLNDAWVRTTLALPDRITLMEVDLATLQSRLLQDRQVQAATVVKILPATLAIRLTERAPVARVTTPAGASLLVGRDGVSFPGRGFAPETLAVLPLLTGIEPDAKGGLPDRITGMDTVADLIARARDLAPQLLQRWTEIDVSRLADDGLLEVHASDIPRIIFSTGYDFSDQLAWLDRVRDVAPGPLKSVNVGLGPRVIAEPAAPEPAAKPGSRPAPAASAPAARTAAVTRGPVFHLGYEN
jgi:cell division septal protein FtsQ